MLRILEAVIDALRLDAEREGAWLVALDTPEFKTLKYRPEFPDHFDTIADARQFCRTFFHWYNTEHKHSGIGYLSPATVYFGQAEQAHAARSQVLDAAYTAHPERFVNQRPVPPPLPKPAGINSKPDDQAEPATPGVPERSEVVPHQDRNRDRLQGNSQRTLS